MGSQTCTVGVGLATAAICFLLSSLDWLQLLFAFVLAGIAWSFWSLLLEHKLRQGRKLARGKQGNSKLTLMRQKPVRMGNVYELPKRPWTGRAAAQRRKSRFW